MPRRLWGVPVAGRGWLWAVPAALLLAFFAYPVGRALAHGISGPDAWVWLLTSPFVRNRVLGAFGQALASVALSAAFALPLAWLYHARAVPFGRLHRALHAAPFVLPVFVVVFGIQDLFGSAGLGILAGLGPYGAVILAHAYYNYGFMARLLHIALERRPHRLEEAASVLGAPPWHARLRTTGRLLAPAGLAAALLVFLFTFNSFGVVLLMGEGRVGTLETMLYQNLRGAFPRHDRAAVLGIAQLAVSAALLAGYFALQRRTADLPREPERAAPRAGIRAQLVAWGALALGMLPALFVLRGSLRVGGEWTLEAWRALVTPGHPFRAGGFDLLHALDRSLFYAFWSCVFAIGLTLLLAYGLRGRSGWPRRLLEGFATLPLGASSVLIGFGYLLAFGAGAFLDLRTTVWAIVLAHGLVAFPFAARAILPAFEQHETRLDDAAAVLGAHGGAVAWRIHWPLMRGAILGAAGMALAISLGDFGASLILMTRDNMSLAIWIEAHQGVAFRSGPQAVARALTAILMALTTLAYVLVERMPRRRLF